MSDDLDELAEAFVTASRGLLGISLRSIGAGPPGLTVPQHRVLVLLAADGPLGVGDIAQQLGVNPSNATRVCDRLQRLHLVERSRSRDDGRAVRVSITARGKEVVDAVSAHRRAQVAEVLSHLPREQARTVVAALVAFNQAAHERTESEWVTTHW